MLLIDKTMVYVVDW